jgi:hypothetical protein
MLEVLSSLAFEEPTKIDWLGAKVKHFIAQAPNQVWAVGIDPGRRFGVAIAALNRIVVYDGIMPQQPEKWRYGAIAIDIIKRIFAGPPANFQVGIVEGAAYNAKYGQVGLAEVRFGFAYGLLQVGVDDVRIVAPATLRKNVLGSGRAVVPYNNWPTLSTNGSDALVALGYALMI